MAGGASVAAGGDANVEALAGGLGRPTVMIVVVALLDELYASILNKSVEPAASLLIATLVVVAPVSVVNRTFRDPMI